MPERRETLSGLTEEEAQEFHKYFMQGFIGFTVVAIVAHILVWMWRPWFPGVRGYASVQDGVTTALSTIAPLLT
jgi:light-harvesting complex 1 beta chain